MGKASASARKRKRTLTARTKTWPAWLGPAAIIVLTLIAYIPAMRAGFIWDDDRYVTNNPLLTAPDGLRRIWFSLDSPSQYFPLVYTAFRFEYAFWGLDPAGYHAVNVFLHIANALLVWLLLRRLSVRGAWLAGAIFALHPIHVESVAWISERKNVLSTLFYLLSVLAWLKFVEKSTANPGRYYVASMASALLALTAKTTACTLPAALVLVLWLRNERIDRRRIVQILPFVGLGIALGLVSVWWEQYHQGTKGPEFAFTPTDRILIASRAIWFYIGKLVWPARLAFNYPRWTIDPRDAVQYMWLAACVVAAFGIWHWRRIIGKGTLAALIFFVAALSPTLGFISLYTFRYTFVADHYQYIASIGLVGLIAAATTREWRQLTLRFVMRYVLPSVVLLILGGLTWRQAQAYQDPPTLWRDVIAKYPASWMAHNNLGTELLAEGDFEEAAEHYAQALRAKPDLPEAHYNLGRAYAAVGKQKEAIAAYEGALRFKPDLGPAHYSLAIALYHEGQYAQAWSEVELARKHGASPDPDFLQALARRMPEPMR